MIGTEIKSHPSQTAVDSFFNYLYYSTQTVKSEMFSRAMAPPFADWNGTAGSISAPHDSRLLQFVTYSAWVGFSCVAGGSRNVFSSVDAGLDGRQ